MTPEVFEFIAQHATKTTAEVALLLSKRKDLPKEFILNQINGRQKAKQKLPFLNQFTAFEFPSGKAVAQSSSEITAKYKSFITAGKRCADLSGGMGIDSYFFSKQFDTVEYVEQNNELAELTKRNFGVLKADSIRVNPTDAHSFLELTPHSFDLIFVDPDRKATKEKAFKIEDCEPNLLDLLPLTWEKTDSCLVKLSPMLDIQQALKQLNNCKEVHVVAANNECKELLFLLEKSYTAEPLIKSINLKRESQQLFSFSPSEEKDSTAIYSSPQNFLYEPNAAILKAGAFNFIGEMYGLKKLAVNTHLYTSEVLIENFPGRTIKIMDTSKAQKKTVEKANVVSRNFGLSPEQIKKKYKIKDGGNQFLYACSLQSKEKIFILGTLVE